MKLSVTEEFLKEFEKRLGEVGSNPEFLGEFAKKVVETTEADDVEILRLAYGLNVGKKFAIELERAMILAGKPEFDVVWISAMIPLSITDALRVLAEKMNRGPDKGEITFLDSLTYG